MRQTMHRMASDNAYQHKDFHGALNVALLYLAERFGPEAVPEYLEQFATSFYAPLTRQIAERGLAALAEHFQHIYAAEGAEVEISIDNDELTLVVPACPAVSYLRAHGDAISPQFVETTRTVNATICAGTPYQAELVAYDEQTGRTVQRFTRRQPA